MADSQTLLTKNKDGVFRCLSKVKLDPRRFSWVEVDSGYGRYKVSRLQHEKGDFFLVFDCKLGVPFSWTVSFSPGLDGRRTGSASQLTWELLLTDHVLPWAKRLKSELEARDFWNNIEECYQAFAPDGHIVESDDPISPDEAAQVRKQLQAFGGVIERHWKISEEQSRLVKRALEDLIAAAGEQRRSAFRYMFIGVLVTIIWGLALTPDEAKHLIRIAKEMFDAVPTMLFQ